MKRNGVAVWYVLLGVAIFLIDRLTKWYAVRHWYHRCDINPFVSLELTFNRGISWGMFHDTSSLLFGFITALIVALTVYIAYIGIQRFKEHQLIIGEVLVVAGSVSNIFDRLYHGGVVDFILLHYRSYCWPLFNVADIAIVCGVGIMVWELYRC